MPPAPFLLPPAFLSGRQGNRTCGFWAGGDTLVLIFIGLEVIHINLGNQEREGRIQSGMTQLLEAALASVAGLLIQKYILMTLHRPLRH